LHPGQRDVLIDLFDREFVETQEAVGMRVIGQFRDRGRPDRFVWLRSFPDMPSRATSLAAFYGGPVWAAHRDAANATMIDSDNVLLLRPTGDIAAFAESAGERAAPDASARPASRVSATIYSLDRPVDDDFRSFFADEVEPLFSNAGARTIACLETEPSENTFPSLPVRTGEHVFAWFGSFANEAALHECEAQLAASTPWTTRVMPALRKRLKAPPERLVLEPTARSALR